MPFGGEGTLWFLLQRDVLEACRAAAMESQICLNGHSTVGHCLLNFTVLGPACVEGKMNICYSNTVVPLWQTRSYNIHDWSAGGSDARCGSSLWLSCAIFVSSKVSLAVCCDMQTSLKIINLKMLRGELHSRLVGQDKKKEGRKRGVSHPFWEWLLRADQRSTFMMGISRKAAKCLECTAENTHYFSLVV